VPEPTVFEVERAIENLKRYKSPDTDKIPTELIKAGRRKIRSEIHKLINSSWITEGLPDEWKESIILPIYRNDDKTGCSNYTGIPLCQQRTKFYPHILLPRLTPYAAEIIWDHQCGFRRKRSTIDHIFCILQILKKKGIK
jgi:hypothetical protein